MKKILLLIVCITMMIMFSIRVSAQNNNKEKIKMKRYVVERSFPEGLEIPINDKGCQIVLGVVSNNTEEHVTWIQSFVSADKKKTFCIYDAPSKEAIRKAAEKNGSPVDKITEVKVLDPYFYK